MDDYENYYENLDPDDYAGVAYLVGGDFPLKGEVVYIHPRNKLLSKVVTYPLYFTSPVIVRHQIDGPKWATEEGFEEGVWNSGYPVVMDPITRYEVAPRIRMWWKRIVWHFR